MNSCKKIVVAFLLILGLQTSTQEVQAFPWKTAAMSVAVIAASVLLYQYWPEISAALATNNPAATNAQCRPIPAATDSQGSSIQASTIKTLLKCIYEKLASFECSSFTSSGCIKELCAHYTQFAQDCVINIVQAARQCTGKCIGMGAKAFSSGSNPFNMGAIERNCTALCAAPYAAQLP